jgi:hypothetical protein
MLTDIKNGIEFVLTYSCNTASISKSDLKLVFSVDCFLKHNTETERPKIVKEIVTKFKNKLFIVGNFMPEIYRHVLLVY